MGEGAGDDCHDDRGRRLSPPVVVCKGKRSKRQRVHAAPPPPPPAAIIAASAEVDSSSSVADDGWRSGAEEEEEEVDMALCLMLLARGGRAGSSSVAPDAAESTAAAAKEGKFRSRRPADGAAGEFVYECRTCGKCFPSFQALGGHRTSHKKPRPSTPPLPPTSTATSDEKKRPPAVAEERTPSSPSPAPHVSADPTPLAIPAVPATPPKHEAAMPINVSRRRQQQGRVHECSICGAEFASGQALGGHMRRHRPLVPASASSSDDAGAAAIKIKEKSLLELDLNMPAPCDDAVETTSPAASAFAAMERSPAAAAMLFPAPASALVDCHY